jgi:hypothetical protein
VALTAAERQAGRDFAAQSARVIAALHDSSPALAVPPEVRHYRHECARPRISTLGRTTAIRLTEHYVRSPARADLGVEAGRFAWVYTSGRCPRCALALRSGGFLADAAERRPLEGSRVQDGW